MSNEVDDLLDHLEGNHTALSQKPPKPVGSNGISSPSTSPNSSNVAVPDLSGPKGWYHGRLSRGQTESLLQGKPNGCFLIRDSTSSLGDYVLSVSESGRASHYIVAARGNSYIIGDQQFRDLPHVIEFYKKQVLDTTILTHAVDVDNPHGTFGGTPSGVLATVRATHDFPGTDREDLPFARGEILQVLRKNDENWWHAQNAQGRTGAIPCTYVTVIQSSTSFAPPVPDTPRPASNSIGSRGSSRLERSQSTIGPPDGLTFGSRLVRSTSDAPPPGFDANMSRTASLRRGSTATDANYIKKVVKVYDEKGLFKAITVSPALYLCKDVREAAMQKFVLTGPRWILYEQLKDGERLLNDNDNILELVLAWGNQEFRLIIRQAKDNVASGLRSPKLPQQSEFTPSKPLDPRVVAQAVAIMNRVPNAYDTSALSFSVGDIIDVIEMSDTGLWKGIAHGRTGHFPMTAASLIEAGLGVGRLQTSSSTGDMNGEFDSMLDQLKTF
ncbi:crk-like protein [Capsaspora owczarzaki ATCC 30864]|uniref:Crk-like protein n=1 Tax=Capsaspora owczarzaki (strain ATCC 30864) TaxID=595528 RepID=A0A0D2U023_CAPO3|nr:crk-like protein [Capsaspora owczarzaki ATCC 30864]KJE88526.1 crk-like protein [Capsaspora owczarzaki ATCC 30864]|eukprot:XP_004365043.2 crk-like protein [Capsaspora owczarzaki ATCC 30864]